MPNYIEPSIVGLAPINTSAHTEALGG